MILGKDDYWLECFEDWESEQALQEQEAEAQYLELVGDSKEVCPWLCK